MSLRVLHQDGKKTERAANTIKKPKPGTHASLPVHGLATNAWIGEQETERNPAIRAHPAAQTRSK
ncbi:MAG: hypothetical protein ABIR10_14660 [Dokdonella sp.]